LLGPSRDADISEGQEREVLLLKASFLIAYVGYLTPKGNWTHTPVYNAERMSG
jgi:hypothetical protein